MEPGLGSGLSIPVITGLPRSRNGRDGAVGIDPADPVVEGVGHVDVARAVHGQSLRDVELSRRCGAAVARAACDAGACQGADSTVRVDDTDPVAVGDVDLAGGSKGDREWTDQRGRFSFAAVTREAALAGAGHGGDGERLEGRRREPALGERQQDHQHGAESDAGAR